MQTPAMILSVERRDRIGSQILLILVILSECTYGSSHFNSLLDDMETPEFEVMYTDVQNAEEMVSVSLNSVASHLSEKYSEIIIYNTSLGSNNSSGQPTDEDLFPRHVRQTARAGEQCTVDNDCIDRSKGVTCVADPTGAGGPNVCSKIDCTTSSTLCTAPEVCLRDPLGGTQSFCGMEVTTLEPIETPMALYVGAGFGFNSKCKSPPTAIHELQTSGVESEIKKKKLNSPGSPDNFEYDVCNWKRARLECIPDRLDYNNPIITPPPKPDDPPVYPLGKCKCLLALGPKAIWVAETKTTKRGQKHGQCFIPANQGHASKCGHQIVIPSGQIIYANKGKLTTKIYVGKSEEFCAPGSVCRSGYNYVGLRCSCKKHYIWVQRTKNENKIVRGMCISDGTQDIEENTAGVRSQITVPFLFPFILAFCNLRLK